MRKSIEEYEGDPHQDMVAELLASNSTIKISVPQSVCALVVECGLSKKKPFSNKNSTADAAILFATVRWAQQHSEETVYFHTFNYADFSDPNARNTPHSDIAEYFAPKTNIHYCADPGTLAKALGHLDPWDYYPRSPDGCTICDGDVLIESIGCVGCGLYPSNAPDHEGYTLRRCRGGYLVDVHDHDGESFRLKCKQCGRKTFDVELADLCSYHQHVSSKD